MVTTSSKSDGVKWNNSALWHLWRELWNDLHLPNTSENMAAVIWLEVYFFFGQIPKVMFLTRTFRAWNSWKECLLLDALNVKLSLISCEPQECCSAACCVLGCVGKAACAGCLSSGLHCQGVWPRIGAAGNLSVSSLWSNVGIRAQLGEVGVGAHEHAAAPLQPALLVREAEGLHELVYVDAAVLVAVNCDGQIRDGVIRDLHL